jgi:hypothetical protein
LLSWNDAEPLGVFLLSTQNHAAGARLMPPARLT